MRVIRTILFDLGDTLLDFGPIDMVALFARGGRLAYRYLQQSGCRLPPFRTYHRRQLWQVRWHYLKSRITRREFNAIDLLVHLGKGMGHELSPGQVEELAWKWYWPLGRCATIEEGLIEMLAGLRREGLRLGIVSNTFVPGQVLDRHLANLGLLEHFPVRVYSCDVGFRKPDRRVFELALGRCGTCPAEAMFVGDSLRADIAGAGRVGMVPVLKDRTGAKRRRRIRPAHRIASLRELPRIVALYSKSHADRVSARPGRRGTP